MAWMTTITHAVFLMPRDKDLHDKFVASHDMTEWEKRQPAIPQYIQYTKEESMMLEDVSKF